MRLTRLAEDAATKLSRLRTVKARQRSDDLLSALVECEEVVLAEN